MHSEELVRQAQWRHPRTVHDTGLPFVKWPAPLDSVEPELVHSLRLAPQAGVEALVRLREAEEVGEVAVVEDLWQGASVYEAQGIKTTGRTCSRRSRGRDVNGSG